MILIPQDPSLIRNWDCSSRARLSGWGRLPIIEAPRIEGGAVVGQSAPGMPHVSGTGRDFWTAAFCFFRFGVRYLDQNRSTGFLNSLPPVHW